MKRYELHIVLHEHGTIEVEAKNLKDAIDGVRSQRIEWNEFAEHGSPHVSVMGGKLVRSKKFPEAVPDTDRGA